MELNLRAIDLNASLNVNENQNSRKSDEKSVKSGAFDEILNKKNEEKDEVKKDYKNPTTKYEDSKKAANNKSNKIEKKDIKDIVEEELENLDEKTVEELKGLFEHLILMGNLDINNFQIDNEKLKNMISEFISSNEDITSMLENKNLSDVLKELLSELTNVSKDEKIDIRDILEKINNTITEEKNSTNVSNTKVKPTVVELQNDYKTSFKDAMNNSKEDSKQSLNQNLSKEDQLLEKLSGNKKDENVINKFNFNNVFTNSEVSTESVQNSNVVINKMTFNEDIIKSIKYMNINDIQDLTVKINPKQLGEIVISLTMEGDSMKAQLKSANKETFAMLNANVKEIVDKLNGESIKISQVEVQVYNEDTTYFSGEENRRNNFNNENKKQNNNEKSLKEISEEISEEKLGTNDNLNMLV